MVHPAGQTHCPETRAAGQPILGTGCGREIEEPVIVINDDGTTSHRCPHCGYEYARWQNVANELED